MFIQTNTTNNTIFFVYELSALNQCIMQGKTTLKDSNLTNYKTQNPTFTIWY